jgi:hypothetical protein
MLVVVSLKIQFMIDKQKSNKEKENMEIVNLISCPRKFGS